MKESEHHRRPKKDHHLKIVQQQVDKAIKWGGWNADQNDLETPTYFRNVSRQPNLMRKMTNPTESHSNN